MVVQNNLKSDLVSTPLKTDKKHRLKQRFDVQRKLGQGTYGKVQLAINRETGQEVAVKTIKKSKIENEQDLVRIRREIQIMSSIQHPHITHIYEVFENKDTIVLVMQFASGGELYDYLSEKKVLSDLDARRIFRQIAAAVYYCHKNKICHRDLKLENILLDEKGNAKIADFGLSNVFDEKHMLNTYCGSPLYASPEIVKGVPYYGPEVDCWSMGVLLYTLVYGAMPFDGSNFKKLVTQISEGDYFEPKKKSNASELIKKLLTVSPSKRATIVDICVDYWVNLGYEHSLLQVAEDMANLTPVRLDLLLALAPEAEALPEEDKPEEISLTKSSSKIDIPDEEDEEEEDYNTDTAANSFAFMKGSRASQLSISQPNLQEAVEDCEDDDSDFLPADIAVALQAECNKRLAESSSFGASLAHISSLGHRSKKVRKSDSASAESENNTETTAKGEKHNPTSLSADKKGSVSDVRKVSKSKSTASENELRPETPNPLSAENIKSYTEAKTEKSQTQSDEKQNTKAVSKKDSLSSSNKVSQSSFVAKRKESLTNQDEKSEAKKVGRPPGKIIIPKTFDSPQSTPSPKPLCSKPLSKVESPSESPSTSPQSEAQENDAKIPEQNKPKSADVTPIEDLNKNIIRSDLKCEQKPEEKKNEDISEEKKNIAKGILKKGIAKARLAERKMSKQSSLDSEISSASSTPVSTGGTSDPMLSFYKTPKPYTKEIDTNVMSKAEIKLSGSRSSNNTLKNEIVNVSKAPLWDSSPCTEERQLQDKNLNWSTISSTIDSEMSSWREQMEESLRRLSPEDERTSNQSYSLNKLDDDKPLVPIARSYKKFTFTKDGACITETKKIYTTPGADGSWTKVEKKTKITTRPGNTEEFEKFRDMHLRNDSPNLTRSDSQSSSGSNDVYDDIFDSWTGDTMLCNMRKMNNMFQKFSRDQFLRRERRRNPFRFFRRTESERNERDNKFDSRSGPSVERETSETEEDYDVHFDDSSAVVYGSQGLWQLLRSANRGVPGRVTINHEPISYGRSVSQDRSGEKFDGNWKRSGSKTSSGYNTGTRSQSRDRNESPREKVLRFVFESPREGFSRGSNIGESTRHEKLTRRNLSRHNPRRDSGVGSDGYESEYSIRHSPDEFSKMGRVPSISSVNSNKQGMVRNFMKSWSKEFMSPPLSPASLGSAKEQLENLPESKKHRVEQWLDMNSDNIHFDSSRPQLGCRKSSQGPSPVYATMRPREYLQYNRSSSDKLADYADFFDSSHRRRGQGLNKMNSPDEGNKPRFRTAAHSPFFEEKDAHNANQSDSSHSESSVHRINFTFSDGRVSSSHSAPQNADRYVRQYSTSKDGSIIVESPPTTTVRLDQLSGRTTTQPFVQMRVSFNRNGRDNQVIPSSPPSKGLWEQQDSLRAPRQDCNITVVREPSPVPGIRQFSTEVQHCIGNSEPAARMSLECEVNSEKSKETKSGKNVSDKLTLPSESCIWNLATTQPCMKDLSELTNTNKHDPMNVDSSKLVCNNHTNHSAHLPHVQSEHDDVASHIASHSTSNGANTPDSLEDMSFEQSFMTHTVHRIAKERYNEMCLEKEMGELDVDIKPLGVLWSNSSSRVNSNCRGLESDQYVTCNNSSSSPSIQSEESEIVDFQQKCLSETSPKIGSIWNQKNACHTFDLLKNLLSDDGLESFSSSKCVSDNSYSKEQQAEFSNLTYSTGSSAFKSESILDQRVPVIDNFASDQITYKDQYHKKMPSLMDDLQSPKEVLQQAMKICHSIK